MSDGHTHPHPPSPSPAGFPGNHAEGAIDAAISHIRGILSASGESLGSPSFAGVEASLRQWAGDLGALLDPADVLPHLKKGGQEHDIFERDGRVYKVTKNGFFGLDPGLDVALESTGTERYRFTLWEATPLQYLERLRLQNLLVPGLVRLEGVLDLGAELAIVTSQIRFNLIPVTTQEIDDWFHIQGFTRIASSSYYRPTDGLAVFDAHDKNVIRFENTLIPFDVIPCLPDPEMLRQIQHVLESGVELNPVRTAHTTSRAGPAPGT